MQKRRGHTKSEFTVENFKLESNELLYGIVLWISEYCCVMLSKANVKDHELVFTSLISKSLQPCVLTDQSFTFLFSLSINVCTLPSSVTLPIDIIFYCLIMQCPNSASSFVIHDLRTPFFRTVSLMIIIMIIVTKTTI